MNVADARADLPERGLSIKQPWATLVLMGRKTIEIRRWSTPMRGRIYLHAGKIPDDRPQGWADIREEWQSLTDRRGGLIGSVEIVDCITYRSLRAFVADRQLHGNDPAWFQPPVMYGFRLANPRIETFRPFLGQVKLFPVPALPSPKRRRIVRPPG